MIYILSFCKVQNFYFKFVPLKKICKLGVKKEAEVDFSFNKKQKPTFTLRYPAVRRL